MFAAGFLMFPMGPSLGLLEGSHLFISHTGFFLAACPFSSMGAPDFTSQIKLFSLLFYSGSVYKRIQHKAVFLYILPGMCEGKGGGESNINTHKSINKAVLFVVFCYLMCF